MKRILTIIFITISAFAKSQVHSGGVIMPSTFKILVPQPIDDKYVVADSTSLNSIPNVYTGLISYSLADSAAFVFNGNKWTKLIASSNVQQDTLLLNLDEVLAKGGKLMADRKTLLGGMEWKISNGRLFLDNGASTSLINYSSHKSYGKVYYDTLHSHYSDLELMPKKAIIDSIKNIHSNEVWVEDFGNGDTAINKAINAVGDGGIINANPTTTHTVSDKVVVKNNQSINNLKIKRAKEQVTTLKYSVTTGQDFIVVDSIPLRWKKGDWLQLCNDSSESSSTLKYSLTIDTIRNDTIHLVNPIYCTATVDSTYTWYAGKKARKVYPLITAKYSDDVYTVPTNAVFNDLVIDGNKNENTTSHYWGVNQSAMLNGRVIFNRPKSFNIPNDNFYGSGIIINNGLADSLLLSYVHYSGDYRKGDSIYGGGVYNSKVSNTNLKANVGGHSEGLITYSYGSRNIEISGNEFKNGATGVMGTISGAKPQNITEGADKNIRWFDNYCDSFDHIASFAISCDDTERAANIIIERNTFSNCGVNYFTESPITREWDCIDTFKFDNYLTNGTEVYGLPDKVIYKPKSTVGLLNVYGQSGFGGVATFNKSGRNIIINENAGRMKFKGGTGGNFLGFDVEDYNGNVYSIFNARVDEGAFRYVAFGDFEQEVLQVYLSDYLYNNNVKITNNGTSDTTFNVVNSNGERTIIVTDVGDVKIKGISNIFTGMSSGDGTSTDINITLPYSSTTATVTPASQDARGSYYVTVSGTTLTIHYSVAPPNGTNNLTYNIQYK